MPTFEPQDPNFEVRVRESFARQIVERYVAAPLRRTSPPGNTRLVSI